MECELLEMKLTDTVLYLKPGLESFEIEPRDMFQSRGPIVFPHATMISVSVVERSNRAGRRSYQW